MLKVIAAILLLALALPAAAQEATLVHEIAVPLQAPQIELSPDGRTVAAFEQIDIVQSVITIQNLPIYLYDTIDGALLGMLVGEQGDIARDVAFSSDGSRLASVHANGELIVWDVAAQEAIASYEWLPMGGVRVDFLAGDDRVSIVTSSGLFASHTIFDLTTGSIVNILQTRPPTFAALQDAASDTMAMGVYGVAAQAAGANGLIYGATPDGEVFAWNPETSERTAISPALPEQQMRFGVRRLQTFDDGTLVFFDDAIDSTVVIGPDGGRAEYPFGGTSFALSGDGLLAFVARADRVLHTADLTQDAPAPQPVLYEFGELSLGGLPILAFDGFSNLVVGGLYNPEGDSAIFVLDLP